MSAQNVSFLASLEVVWKFLVVGWGVLWWLRPILVFSLSLSQAELLFVIFNLISNPFGIVLNVYQNSCNMIVLRKWIRQNTIVNLNTCFYIVDDILSGLWGTDVIVCGDHFICYDCQDINGRSCLMYATCQYHISYFKHSRTFPDSQPPFEILCLLLAYPLYLVHIYRVSHKKIYLFKTSISQAPNITQKKFSIGNESRDILFQKHKF